MGWNSLEWRTRDPLFHGLSDPSFVYFVHSYYPDPAEEDLVTASSTHGVSFAAACRRGNVRGVQFHPEKSQSTGLRMLENFVNELRGAKN
jgi:glutamine amidotransferase